LKLGFNDSENDPILFSTGLHPDLQSLSFF
jgi:hypothetical protein